MKRDLKYILKKVIIGVALFLIIGFIKSCEVHAETFSIQDNYGIIYYNPAGHDINNTRQNVLYYNSSTANPASIKSRGYVVSNDNGAQGTEQGSYLIDIYIYGVGTFYQSYSCNGFTSNFGWMSSTDGTWYFSSSVSKSQCIAIEKTTFNNYNAIHLLYRWDIVDSNGAGVGGADIQITQYNLFTASSTGSNIGYSLGSLVPYDLSIVESFKNGQYMQNIENAIQTQTQTQHQDSLNEQNAINNQTSAITNDNIDNADSKASEWASKSLSDNAVANMVTMPITLLQAYLNGLNGSCSSFSLGTLYDHELTLPCINLSSYFGSTLWGVIDILFSGFMIYALGKKFVKIFNDFTNLRDNQVDELYGGGN